MSGEAIIVIGAGGHAKVLIDALQAGGIGIKGLTDASPERHGKTILGLRVIGDDSVLQSHPPETTLLVNGIGSTASMAARRRVYESLKARGYRFASVVHPSAVISHHSVIGEGVQIMAGVVVQAGARIGEDTILNTRAGIDHDCDIGRHCHIAPGATLSGSVTVGEGTHVGVNASVIHGLRIGRGCLVAAGAVVIRHVLDGKRVSGVPAREMAGK